MEIYSSGNVDLSSKLAIVPSAAVSSATDFSQCHNMKNYYNIIDSICNIDTMRQAELFVGNMARHPTNEVDEEQGTTPGSNWPSLDNIRGAASGKLGHLSEVSRSLVDRKLSTASSKLSIVGSGLKKFSPTRLSISSRRTPKEN
jgi:hypothetical protein